MNVFDFSDMLDCRRNQLLAEAEHERLAAQVPPTGRGMRLEVAALCYVLADWLDGDRYQRQAESRREDWVWGSLSA